MPPQTRRPPADGPVGAIALDAPDREGIERVDVLDAIKRRRMHRRFTAEPVSRADLETLAWAAGRGPMGGGQLVRRLVIVDDPILMRTVAEVTPCWLSNAPALIVVCTDTVVAHDKMGRLGRDFISQLDAGAAAENVALAAIPLGLGVCFSRCTVDAALQEVLEMPREVRPDLLIAVGHPAPQASRVGKLASRIVYHNRFGSPWEAA